MKLSEFHYDLPPEAIAQEPVEPRDHSKLLVLDRRAKTIEHKHFYDLVDYVRPGDVFITNATKVFPARLRGKKSTGGKIELLLIEPLPSGRHKAGPYEVIRSNEIHSTHSDEINSSVVAGLVPARKLDARKSESSECWRALVRGATQPAKLVFPEGLEASMVERLAEGEWAVEFSDPNVREYLTQHGEMPLPPYIKRSSPRSSDLDRYQTVYAEKEGAVAAPTAGFHFTPELLERIKQKGATVLSIILHVGWGTFRPVRAEQVEEHQMLPETYEVSESVTEEITHARRAGRRIIAVGTTSVRTLETICDASGVYHPGSGQAHLFIYPGYQFKGVDAVITNFHLPDSTPLLLANAFYSFNAATANNLNVVAPAAVGRGLSKNDGSRLTTCRDDDRKNGESFSLRFAYEEAIQKGYRFYSYGDAMFIQ